MNTRRRAIISNADSPKFLTWVGSTGDTSRGIRFNFDIRLLSTMTLSYDFEVQVSSWAGMICAVDFNNTIWANNNNQFNVYRNQAGRFDVLYFGSSATGQLSNTGDQAGRHQINLKADGIYLESKKVLAISARQSCAEGDKMYINGYKIYSFKIWDGDTLIHDFVPALYGEYYGLWDNVTKSFIRNATGTITGD